MKRINSDLIRMMYIRHVVACSSQSITLPRSACRETERSKLAVFLHRMGSGIVVIRAHVGVGLRRTGRDRR